MILMEFKVNEQACKNLITEMYNNLKGIQSLVNELESKDAVLRAALGEDYGAIAKSIRAMSGELMNAYQEFNTIIDNTTEYVARVQKIKDILD